MFDYFCWGCMAQPTTIDHSWIKCSKNDPIFGGLRYLKIVQDYHLKIHCISNAWYIMIYPIHPYLNTWGKSNDDPSYVPPKGQASTGWTSRKKAEPGFWACKNCRVIIGYVLVAYGIIYWLVVWNIFPYIYIGNNNPNWLILFKGVETTNQYIYTYIHTRYYCYCILEFNLYI